MTGEGDTFDYLLADRLHKTVAELEAIPNAEYETWRQYLNVRGVLDDLARRTAEHRR